MTQGEGTPQQDLSSIYVCDELYSIKINEILFKWREISGTEIVKAMGKGVDPNEVDKAAYIRRIIQLALVEPKNLNIDKLKPKVLVQLVGEIEDSLGLSEVVQKNLSKRSLESPASTPSPTSLESE